jgi:hypothetical protein
MQEKMELDVLNVIATLLDPVMKNHMYNMKIPDALVTKAKTKLRALMRSIGTGEVLANLDHEKNDAPAPPQKKRRTDDPTSMYDEFEDELEEIHDNGAKILVISNLDARKNKIFATVNLALLVNQGTTANFNILLWRKLKGAPTLPIMSRVARFGFVHPYIQLQIGVKLLGCREYANQAFWTEAKFRANFMQLS